MVFLFLSAWVGCVPQRAISPQASRGSPSSDISGEALRTQLTALREENEKAQTRMAENRQKIASLEQELISLRDAIDALNALHRSSADDQSNRGWIHESEKGFPPMSLRTPSPDATRLYRTAFEAYFFHGDYPTAISRFQEFLTTFPPNDLTDNALYWMGESYYAQGDFQSAISSFHKLVDTNPYSNHVPEALLKIALSYSELRNPQKAREFLVRIMDSYPFSQAAKSAKTKLDQLE